MTTPAARREYEFTLPIGLSDESGHVVRDGTLRKMTGRDEAILAEPQNQRNGGRLVTELLHSCLVRLGDQETLSRERISAMYSADRNYLLLRLRSVTFGPTLQAVYRCPACSATMEVEENIETLPVRRLENGSAPDDIQIELEDGYVDAGGEVHTGMTLRLPTGEDEAAVAPQMRKNASLGKNALLARCVKLLGDVPQHRLRALGPKIMVELTMSDRRAIDKALNSAAPGIDLVRDLECHHCGHDFKSNLDLSHFLALD